MYAWISSQARTPVTVPGVYACGVLGVVINTWRESVLKATNYKLEVEKKSDKIISAQLIESRKNVHEKEIQDFNLKLQNHFNQSQDLKMREKSLVEEVESLRADSWKKNTLLREFLTKLKS